MANQQTFIQGFGTDGGQVTSLSDIQGSGLSLPASNTGFIDIRAGGKLQQLFENESNSSVLYAGQHVRDDYLKGIAAGRFDYRNPNQGQKDLIDPSRSPFASSAARRDLDLVRDFISSKGGTKHQLNQVMLQGYQSFDETKIYNPASPVLAVARNSTFGLLDRPTRHIDTSNILSGIIGASGVGKVVSSIGGILGKAPARPAPPRSSVASAASNGIGLATLTSFVGGGDRSSEVMPIGGLGDVKGLLRGRTATDAYNNPVYTKLVSSNGSGILGNLLSSIGRSFQNNTLIGGIAPPKQPWGADYRADEKTYELYLNAGERFNPDASGVSGGGLLSNLLSQIGFGKKTTYSRGVRQRFNGKAEITADLKRTIVVAPNSSSPTQRTDQVGGLSLDVGSRQGNDIDSTSPPSGLDDTNKYTDTVKVEDGIEYSDQLLNYKSMITGDDRNYKNFNKTQFNDPIKDNVKDLLDDFANSANKIAGIDKYSVNDTTTIYPLQFSRFDGFNRYGQDYLRYTDSTKITANSGNLTQQGRQLRSEEAGGYPSLNLTPKSRKSRPTNDVDYVNSLGVLDSEEFNDSYVDRNGKYGPDIVSFYFYDIVNSKYIPFNATIQGLQDQNNADWAVIDYIGRPDKLYHYRGYQRSVTFNFKAVAHSVKELLPMWSRINYLTGMTRPANYTLQQNGGYMIPPVLQLTLGDFYKNHNVVLNSCLVEIPDDASWEVLSEFNSDDWNYGQNKAFSWKDSSGKYAQFPREADISVNMYVLEKDIPSAGKAIWGDAPVKLNDDRIEITPTDPVTFSDNLRTINHR
jgi:hypothetical protein